MHARTRVSLSYFQLQTFSGMSYDHKWAHLFARLGYLLQTTTRQHVLTQGQRWRAPGEAYHADIPQLAPYCWCCKFPNVWSPFWTQKDLSVSLHAACDDWWSARSSLVLLQFDKWRLQSQKEKEFFCFFFSKKQLLYPFSLIEIIWKGRWCWSRGIIPRNRDCFFAWI